MKKCFSVKVFAWSVLMLTVLACGGGDSGLTGSFLNKSFNIRYINNNALPVHLLQGSELPDPNVNRLQSGENVVRGNFATGWDSASQNRSTSFRAVRNGQELAAQEFFISGQQAKDAGNEIIVTFTAGGALVVELSPPQG